MHYDDILIALFKPFINDAPPGPSSTSPKFKDCHARRQIDQSINHAKDMLNIYGSYYGWAHSLPYMLHKLVTVAFHSLEDLSNLDSRSSLIAIADAMGQMARSWFAAKPVLRMVELCAEKLGIELPSEIHEIISRCLDDDAWVRDGLGQVLKLYPSGSFRAYFYDMKLEDMLTDWEGLDFQDEGELFCGGEIVVVVVVTTASNPSKRPAMKRGAVETFRIVQCRSI
jgi:hypothetical protein